MIWTAMQDGNRKVGIKSHVVHTVRSFVVEERKERPLQNCSACTFNHSPRRALPRALFHARSACPRSACQSSAGSASWLSMTIDIVGPDLACRP
jgi:hypothetical protein